MIKLKCITCGNEHQWEDKELKYVFAGLGTKRERGPEKIYAGTIKLFCEKCNHRIKASFHFWEYPATVLNYADFDEEGCVVMEEPNYQSYLKVMEVVN